MLGYLSAAGVYCNLGLVCARLQCTGPDLHDEQIEETDNEIELESDLHYKQIEETDNEIELEPDLHDEQIEETGFLQAPSRAREYHPLAYGLVFDSCPSVPSSG